MTIDARQRILDAFHAVLLEGRYDALTVSALLRRARVGRTSFYAHFKGKEDLLGHSMGQLTDALRRAAQGRVGNHGDWAFLEPLLWHLDSHRAIYQAFVGHESEQALEWQVRKMLRLLLSEDLARRSRPAEALQLDWWVGGLWGVLVAWIERRLNLDVPQLAEALTAQLSGQAAVAHRGLPSAARAG